MTQWGHCIHSSQLATLVLTFDVAALDCCLSLKLLFSILHFLAPPPGWMDGWGERVPYRCKHDDPPLLLSLDLPLSGQGYSSSCPPLPLCTDVGQSASHPLSGQAAWNCPVILKVGFVGRVGQHLGRIFIPKMTAKGEGLACREEGEGGGGGGGGTVWSRLKIKS